MGGVLLLGETTGLLSLSLDPVLMALLFAQTFSLGGGAGTTFSGSPSCLEVVVWFPCEDESSSRLLKTSFSTERSLSRRLGALLDVFPVCDDSLPVRERSVAWSSLRQLGCLSLGLRSGPLFLSSSSCLCSLSCSFLSLSSTSLSLAAVSTGLAPPKMDAARPDETIGPLLCSSSLGTLRGFRFSLGL